MARYKRTDAGERRTTMLGVQLTPSERAELEEAAKGQGAPNLSTYARELLFRRSTAVVAATRRNPEAAAIMQELRVGGIALTNPGNNLNQIARHLNTTGDLRDFRELRDTLEAVREAADMIKRAAARVLDL
jgi:Bacterial mobilisation protein (MobC)